MSESEIEIFIAKRLKSLRKEKRIPLKKMASIAGVSYTTVQKYESAEIRISVNSLHKIARFLDVSINTFFPDVVGGDMPAAEKELLDIFRGLRCESKSKEAILKYFSAA